MVCTSFTRTLLLVRMNSDAPALRPTVCTQTHIILDYWTGPRHGLMHDYVTLVGYALLKFDTHTLMSSRQFLRVKNEFEQL